MQLSSPSHIPNPKSKTYKFDKTLFLSWCREFNFFQLFLISTKVRSGNYNVTLHRFMFLWMSGVGSGCGHYRSLSGLRLEIISRPGPSVVSDSISRHVRVQGWSVKTPTIYISGKGLLRDDKFFWLCVVMFLPAGNNAGLFSGSGIIFFLCMWCEFCDRRIISY